MFNVKSMFSAAATSTSASEICRLQKCEDQLIAMRGGLTALLADLHEAVNAAARSADLSSLMARGDEPVVQRHAERLIGDAQRLRAISRSLSQL